jgi:hypothetical protein
LTLPDRPGLLARALVACSLLVALGCSEPPQTTSTRPGPAQSLPVQVPQGIVDFTTALQQLELPGTTVLRTEDLLVIALEDDFYEPRLLADTKQGLSAADAMAVPGMSVVIGSGFVSELHGLRPVGLLQIKGRILSDVQPHGYTRIVGISDSGVGVVHRGNFQRGLFSAALQAGPGIVEAGKLDISVRDLERPKYFRSFIATCDAMTVVGISLDPVNLFTLGQQLLAQLPTRGIACDEVVNLAGDREAVLAVRSPIDNIPVYHGNPNTHKVALFGFLARSGVTSEQ